MITGKHWAAVRAAERRGRQRLADVVRQRRWEEDYPEEAEMRRACDLAGFRAMAYRDGATRYFLGVYGGSGEVWEGCVDGSLLVYRDSKCVGWFKG